MLCSSLIKIRNLVKHMKKQNNKTSKYYIYWWKLKTKGLMFFVHAICKIPNFNLWTAKHLAQASCTELTLENTNCLMMHSYSHTKNSSKIGEISWKYRYKEVKNATLEMISQHYCDKLCKWIFVSKTFFSNSNRSKRRWPQEETWVFWK